MENPKVDYVFGLHIAADIPSGVFGIRGGPFMAKPDAFKIRVIGKGGHGSAPHRTVDPVYIAAQVTIALQGVSGRMVNPIRPFVISVCSVHGGYEEQRDTGRGRLWRARCGRSRRTRGPRPSPT